MDKIDDGGPAFPIKGFCADASGAFSGEVITANGMTLRDYFAARFMERAQSLCETSEGGWDFHNAAQCCYAMADAMIEAGAS